MGLGRLIGAGEKMHDISGGANSRKLFRPEKIGRKRRLGIADVRALIYRLQALVGGGEKALKRARRELVRIERAHDFTVEAWPMFQDVLGRLAVKTTRPIGLPLDSTPFWFRYGYPLAAHRSRSTLPEESDVVIIGAGLTGASAAYHLIDAVREQKWRVVVVDQGDPAGEASGRNGGNFELIPENAVGIYEGLAVERLAFLQRRHPGIPFEVAQAVSEREASLVLGLALRNRDLSKGIIIRERIDCDFSPRGWLYLAGTDDEEQGICDELALAAQHGQKIEIWSRRKIRQEFGFENDFLGRFIPGDGSYHPVKYVCGLLQRALAAGVELYARVKVIQVKSASGQPHRIITDEGTINAQHVIVATNAFTGALFNEMRAIQPYQSQVMLTESAPDRARGRIVTSEAGPVFFNQPRDGAGKGRAPLIMGGGADRRMTNPASRRRSPQIHAQLIALRDQFYPELRGQPPSAEWIGPMGFTPDGLPCIGFLRPGLIIAAGFNGYGGTYTTAAGHAAAHMARTGTAPDWVPDDVFSPHRFATAEPVFMSEKDSLWRIAASLCNQLDLVNARMSEALSIQPRTQRLSPNLSVDGADARMRSASLMVTPEEIKAFPLFAIFALDEIRDLLALMESWRCPKGSQLFSQGSPGGSCFLIVRGAVDVSLEVHGEDQLLARLGPGSILGQVSVITGAPRNASCSAASDALIAELQCTPCEHLLNGGTPMALKFLAALNEGLIAALRGADRRLMKLMAAERESSGATSVAWPDLGASRRGR